MDVTLNYATDLFEARTMERIGQNLGNLLAGVTAMPATKLSSLQLMDPAQLELVLHGFNDTDEPYPASKTVHQLFERTAAYRPGTVCLVSSTARLTYGAVNARANQLAHWLASKGVGAGTAVGVSSHKCPELYITLLAVIKAGGAYVPLDPTLPVERAAYMMQQTGVRLLLTAVGNELAQLPGVEAVAIDQGWQQFGGQPISNLPNCAGPADIAYCIFTSGSTGQPKASIRPPIAFRLVFKGVHPAVTLPIPIGDCCCNSAM